MAVHNPATEDAVARTFAEAVRAESAARRLWVLVSGSTVELWLLTEPTHADTERRLYGASRLLYEAFPDTDIRVRVVNPRLFDTPEPEQLIPPGADEVPLRQTS